MTESLPAHIRGALGSLLPALALLSGGAGCGRKRVESLLIPCMVSGSLQGLGPCRTTVRLALPLGASDLLFVLSFRQAHPNFGAFNLPVPLPHGLLLPRHLQPPPFPLSSEKTQLPCFRCQSLSLVPFLCPLHFSPEPSTSLPLTQMFYGLPSECYSNVPMLQTLQRCGLAHWRCSVDFVDLISLWRPQSGV